MSTIVAMPLHRSVREVTQRLDPVGPSFAFQVGSRVEVARLFRLAKPCPGPAIYLIENAAYFDRPGIYGDETSDYADNARRFALFARAALAVLPQIAPSARILHAHDWHTALAPVYLRTAHAGEPYYDRLRTVLSVHNAGFQGQFSSDTVADLGLAGELYDWRGLEWFGRMNILKGGLAFSDVVVTVSPSHVHELRTPQGGFGLDDTFAALGDRFVGILNGIDCSVWNPQDDPAYIKLLRSARDGAVFDHIPLVSARYQGQGRRASTPLEIWTFNRRVRAVRPGWTLRVQAEAPFRLRWSADEWRNVHDACSASTAARIDFVDIPLAPDQEAPLRFTFLWTETGQWEGRDFMVSIDGGREL
jgi:hypothetical protein